MASALDVDADGDSGDWRMVFVARLAEDALGFKKGAVLRQSSAVEFKPGMMLSFSTPSAVAMALDVAQIAATEAIELRLRLGYQQIDTGPGANSSFGITAESLPSLYDFLERSMVAAVLLIRR